ncbi:hypothetical protein SDC9_168462 [bioreactor metagenome]|uniref:Uncharacterized protein n=1 Tax=bioreactor metagenome TaxID=1076179 RepID=A0A645GB21_9ZZZZ
MSISIKYGLMFQVQFLKFQYITPLFLYYTAMDRAVGTMLIFLQIGYDSFTCSYQKKKRGIYSLS